jgi:hypothetical protein
VIQSAIIQASLGEREATCYSGIAEAGDAGPFSARQACMSMPGTCGCRFNVSTKSPPALEDPPCCGPSPTTRPADLGRKLELHG